MVIETFARKNRGKFTIINCIKPNHPLLFIIVSNYMKIGKKDKKENTNIRLVTLGEE